jgi:hypothetical protein
MRCRRGYTFSESPDTHVQLPHVSARRPPVMGSAAAALPPPRVPDGSDDWFGSRCGVT